MKLGLLIGGLLLTAISGKAQVTAINENFESFTAGTGAAWPQNNWNRVQSGSGPWVYVDNSNAADKHIQYYSFFTTNTPGYAIAPQIVAPNGSQTLTFKSSLTAGSSAGSTGTIEVGFVDGVTTADMASFTKIGNTITLTSTDTQYSVPIPASNKQYIAFRIVGSLNHTAIQLDDISYAVSSILAVSDQAKSKESVQFAVNSDNTVLQFVAKKEPKKIQIYSAGGQKTAEGKLSGRSFDISTLQTGVYYILIETAEGEIVKSKFIKK